MLPRDYDTQTCSVARALEVVGERWTLLVVRDALKGTTRFEDFQASLGIATNTLTKRLRSVCDAGILERRQYQERPPRHEYVLTKKGQDLGAVVFALMNWGDRYYAPDGPPLRVLHRDCGGEVDATSRCQRCGAERLKADRVAYAPGPGAAGRRAEAGSRSGSPSSQ